jgi:protein gp37
MTNLNSKIEWTDSTWNVVTGCTKVSPGYDNCYAETLTERFHGKGSFAEVKLHHDRLKAPLRWRKPRRVFVNSMSDLFHNDVPDEFIARVWAAMALTPQHTYQILTKRHGRMRSLLSSERFRVWTWAAQAELGGTCTPDDTWPLPNVWGGVSVEDQRAAEIRIPALVETPLAGRFLSCEPLIGFVDLSVTWVRLGTLPVAPLGIHYDQDTGIGKHLISWVIAGGESGPAARPCDPEWIRSLVKQCQAAQVPVFVKQLGTVWARQNGADSKGGDPQYWPEDLRIREFPAVNAA